MSQLAGSKRKEPAAPNLSDEIRAAKKALDCPSFTCPSTGGVPINSNKPSACSSMLINQSTCVQTNKIFNEEYLKATGLFAGDDRRIQPVVLVLQGETTIIARATHNGCREGEELEERRCAAPPSSSRSSPSQKEVQVENGTGSPHLLVG